MVSQFPNLYAGKISLKLIWEGFEVKGKREQVEQNRKRGGDMKSWSFLGIELVMGLYKACTVLHPKTFSSAYYKIFSGSFSYLFFYLRFKVEMSNHMCKLKK